MKTMKIKLGMFFAVLLVGLVACDDDFGIVGNGRPETETRSARYFNELSSSGSFNVYVSQGEERSIEITAESNLLPYIETDFDGDRLRIRTLGMHTLHETYPINIYLVTPDLEELVLSGSGRIETESFAADQFSVVVSGSGEIVTSVNADELDAVISGSGKIFLEGACGEAEMGISGSGIIDAYDLAAGDCKVVVSGSGSAWVNVEDNLDVRISGSGNVHYINFPYVTSSTSGSGQVINEN
ncbi:head GIN domain-containing protein [Mangrovibacterium diazotrophicum]|nr:head GIN domain-containing protein [Mangrovibacterium diazotrophicum]